MRGLRLFAAALALSGVGGLHAAAHALEEDHSHSYDEDIPHSHGHDLQSEDGFWAGVLPARTALPLRAGAAVALDVPAGARLPSFPRTKSVLSRGGAPPGRCIPPLPARAPPS